MKNIFSSYSSLVQNDLHSIMISNIYFNDGQSR